jgi:hypothetical protein
LCKQFSGQDRRCFILLVSMPFFYFCHMHSLGLLNVFFQSSDALQIGKQAKNKK